MRRAALSLALAALVPVAAFVAGGAPRRASAQSEPPSLVVPGLQLDAKSPNARVTLTNLSAESADFYTLSFQIYHADGHIAALPVTLANPLLAGRSVTIDVAAVVNGFRAGQGLGPFAGPVTLVVRGASCAETETCPVGATPRPFGPALIHVAALQSAGGAFVEGAARWVHPN